MTTEPTATLAATVLPSGVAVVNATPHPITFRYASTDVTVPPCGLTVSALAVETEAGERHGARLVRTVFEPTPAGAAELAAIEAACPTALVVGSLVSAQAYPGQVVAMIPAPGFGRVAPAEKKMSASKFTTF